MYGQIARDGSTKQTQINGGYVSGGVTVFTETSNDQKPSRSETFTNEGSLGGNISEHRCYICKKNIPFGTGSLRAQRNTQHEKKTFPL